jgi:hypothetical protein
MALYRSKGLKGFEGGICPSFKTCGKSSRRVPTTPSSGAERGTERATLASHLGPGLLSARLVQASRGPHEGAGRVSRRSTEGLVDPGTRGTLFPHLRMGGQPPDGAQEEERGARSTEKLISEGEG